MLFIYTFKPINNQDQSPNLIYFHGFNSLYIDIDFHLSKDLKTDNISNWEIHPKLFGMMVSQSGYTIHLIQPPGFGQLNNINLICLAGFMKILSKDFVKKWPKMILNIHPSILPYFKGLNAQKQAIENNAKYSGCTVHFVNEVMDGGEIIDQKIVNISTHDDEDSLSKKILMEEHKLYIKVLKKLEKNYGKSK